MTARRNAENERVERIALPVFLCAVGAALCYAGYMVVRGGNLVHILYFTLYLVGLFFSLLLFSRTYGFLVSVTSRFCGEKGGCDLVGASRGAFVYGEITWSDLGVVYFLCMLLICAVFTFDANGLAYVISSLIAFPYVVYSIWYQWMVAHAWCRMCLAVQVILVLLSGLSVWLMQTTSGPLRLAGFIPMCLMVMVISSAFIVFKRLLKASVQYKGLSKRHMALKFSNLACTLYTSGPLERIDGRRIVFNAKAPDKITVVFRFGCSPCMFHMEEIIDTIEQMPNIAIEFVFNTWQTQLKDELPLMLYFATQYQKEPSLFLENLRNYAENYPLSKGRYTVLWGNPMQIETGVKELVKAHLGWCARHGIKQTPTYMLNDRIVSSCYSFDDLLMAVNPGKATMSY